MKKLQKPSSKAFDDLMNTCHDEVREAFKWYITDENILAYSTDMEIVFLNEREVRLLWTSFALEHEIEYGLESTIWEDEYQDIFFLFVREHLFLGKDSAYFSHIMDYAYGLYLETEWRLPTVEELNAMYNKTTGKAVTTGFASDYYWSSTTYVRNTSNAWFVNFYDGYTSDSDKTNSFYVRCVREVEGILELAPSSEKDMPWLDAVEYARKLKVKKEDIIRLKLKGWCYEKVLR